MEKPTRGEAKTKNVVGARVRAARLAHQPPMEQVELAARLSTLLGTEYGQTTISRLENGRRPVTDFELLTLAETLGVGVLWLLYGETPPAQNAPFVNR